MEPTARFGRRLERRLKVAAWGFRSSSAISRLMVPMHRATIWLSTFATGMWSSWSEWMTPFRVNDRQAKHYRIGNVFLAGDASHIHSPVGGQGMNTGIQDVANLGWKLAAVLRGGDLVLLDSYEEERGAVGKALLRFTERGLKLATASNPLLETVRDDLLSALSSLTPVQKAMLGFISETGINYRSSSIVKDFGGD